MTAAVAFRVDASAALGIGHLMRCLTLADALRAEGVYTRFVSRSLADAHRQLIGDRGHDSVVLGNAADGPVAPGRLTTDAGTDARDTATALRDRSWNWLVVDHYALDSQWEESLRQTAPRILAIDDLADRAHACDVLLDQNYLPGDRYDGKVPAGCVRLVGPGYALLRPEYRQQREAMRPRNGSVNRVLVFFGSDPFDLTARATAALSDPRLEHLDVDIVHTGDAARRTALESWAAHRGRATVSGPRPHLADLMAAADLSVGAGGSTTWERMCLGLPSVVVTLADNQVPLAARLAQEGLIRLLGDAAHVTADDMRQALLDEVTNHRQAASIGAVMQLSDGLGTSRVIDTLRRVGPW